MASQTRSPGTAANIDRDSKTDWANVDNAKVDDANTSSNDNAANTYTDWLRVTNFGFTIPVDAVSIDGIVVEYDISQSNGNWTDSSIRLVLNASVVGEDKATADAYPTATGTYQSRGDINDVWSWTPSITNINDSTFGFQVSALNTHKTQVRSGVIRHMRVTVYYTEAAPSVTASTHTYFKTPIFRDGIRTKFIYQSGQFNVFSGMRKTSVTATTWILAPISSSSSYFYPSGMVNGGVWIWVSGSYMGGGK